MKKRHDLISFKRPDNDDAARWAIYSIGQARWQEGSFKTRGDADCAARAMERRG